MPTLGDNAMSETADYVTDCVIIGTGPAGSSLASFLGTYGIRGIVVGKTSTTSHTPRAHITNMATMECMRDVGLETECRKAGLDHSYMAYTHWGETMAGEEYGRVHAWGNGPAEAEYKAASPCAPMDLAQSLLEPILVRKALSTGFIVRFNTEFLSFSEDESHHSVRVLVHDRIFDRQYTIDCKYLFGCDGARSTVLHQLGIPVFKGGGGGTQVWNVLVRVDLSHLMQFRGGNLHWNFQEDHLHPGKLLVVHPRMVTPWKEWVVGFSWAPGSAPVQEITPSHEDWIQRLKKMIGDEGAQPEILDISKWQLNNEVAESYSRRRVFCLGDAVHRHTPGGGLGSNTSIQDAYNLAWKVAHVLKGLAGTELLETYSVERQPVGADVTSNAMNAVFAHAAIWDILGVIGGSPERMKEQQKKLREDSQGGRELREALHHALQGTQYELQGIGIEMNQLYKSSAVWAQDEAKPIVHPEPRLRYHKTTYPGARLPHAWLNTPIPSHPVSTIDLAGKGRFTVFTGVGGDQWKTSAAQVAAALKLTIHVVSIGYRQDYEDPSYEWERWREVEDSGAVLVRPDRYVAWRINRLPSDCEAVLTTVFRRILSLSDE